MNGIGVTPRPAPSVDRTVVPLAVLDRWAPVVDRENRFPTESVAALHAAGLVGYFVPAQYGGPGGHYRGYCEIAAQIGEACVSTALIWAMHCQQTLVLVDHAPERHADVLHAVARDGALIASVTTEKVKGGALLTADAPLEPAGDGYRVYREAPVVSYGAEAAYYLATMRRARDRPETDVALVLVSRDDGTVTVTGDWRAMGMHGTRSVPLTIDAIVPAGRIVGPDFRPIALRTMVPCGQLGWAAAWYGGARGALRRFIADARRRGDRRLTSDLFLTRVAEIRLSLDLIAALLTSTADRLDRMRDENAPDAEYEAIDYNITINNVKIAASRLAADVADRLIELAGFGGGYVQHDTLQLERVFRDLRSGPLMFSNDRLLQSNGRLTLVEQAHGGAFWR